MYNDISINGEAIVLIAIENKLTIHGRDRALTMAEQRTFATYLKNEGFLDHVKMDAVFLNSMTVCGKFITIVHVNGEPGVRSEARVSPAEQQTILHYLKAEGFLPPDKPRQEPEEPIL